MMAGTRIAKWLPRRLTTAETIVVLAIIAVLIALLFPGPQWVGDGSLTIPVRVFVFDAARGTPIAGARVVVSAGRALPWSIASDGNRSMFAKENLSHDRARLDDVAIGNDPAGRMSAGVTAEDGTASGDCTFQTTASGRNPTPRAWLAGARVYVGADGYGGVVVPVRYDSESVIALKQRKEVFVTVGLMPQ